MAGNADEGAVWNHHSADREGAERLDSLVSMCSFVSPYLRLDVIDADFVAVGGGWSGLVFSGCARLGCVTGCEHMDVRRQIHVVVNLVIHLEVRAILGDWVLAIGEIQVHRAFEPLRQATQPRTTDKLFIICRALRGIGYGTGMNHHDAATAFRVFIEQDPLFRFEISTAIAVNDEDIGGVELRFGREVVTASGLGASLV